MAPRRQLKAPQTAHYGPLAPISIPDAIRQEYADLGEVISRKFGVESARPFQIDGVLYQAMGCDAILHAGTGLGKTLVATTVHAIDKPMFKDRVTIMVSPLIALQSDMVEKFNARPETRAVVINSTMKAHELSAVIRDILQKKYRILLISPESLLSQRIRDDLLLKPEFKKLVLSIVIDEAHCVSVWGSGFRKKYGTLHVIRDYLRNVPIMAMSATLTPRVLRDIASKLHMGKSYGFINVGNERPELSIIVRRCQFPMSSFWDLTFLFKDDVFHPLDIPKTFIFLDNKSQAYHVIDALRSYLPEHLRHLGLIRPFNARHGTQYLSDAMEQFKQGNVRILLCTDAAGMGCDIPDVDITIQWRVTLLSNLIQRWGRTARGPGRIGLVILFVEPSAYSYNPTIPASEESGKPEAKSTSSKIKKSLREPLLKGGFRSSVPGAQPELRDDSPYEGTLAMVQTNGCHRKVWMAAFQNDPVQPIVKCCLAKTCSPELLDKIKPLNRPPTTRPTIKKSPKKGVPHLPTQAELITWRSRIWDQYHLHATWGAEGLLGDDLVDFLASIGPIDDVDTLERYLSPRWSWWGHYGDDLAQLVVRLKTPYTPKPSKPRNPGKRKAAAPEPEGRPGASSTSTHTPSASSAQQDLQPCSSALTSKKACLSAAGLKDEPLPHTSSVAGGDNPPALSQAQMSLSWAIPGYTHEAIGNMSDQASHEHSFHANS